MPQGPSLLPAAPNLVTTQAPTPGVSPGQVALPYRELADTFAKTGEAAETFAETQAKYEGLQAGANATVNPDGTVQIPKAPIIGPASQNYEQAVKMGVLAKGEGAVKDKTRQIMLDHMDDPEGYREATDAFRDTTISQYAKSGSPDVGIALGRAIDSSSTFTYRMLVNQKRSLDLKESWQNIQDGRTSAMDDLHVLARGGDTSSPQFQQAFSKYTTLTQQATQNPALGYSPQKAQFDTEQLQAQLHGDVFLNHIDQVYHDPTAGPDGTARGGASAALQAAQSVLTDPNVRLSPAQRQQFYSKAVGEIHANEAVRRQDVQEARASEQALDQTSILGGRVEPEDVNRVGSAYTAAGDPASAARFYAKMARKPLNDDFGRQPLGDQNDQLRTLISAAPTTAAEANLVNYESGGNPRSVNKFGYAGLYQFGAPLLADLGMYKPGAGENMAAWSSSGASAPGKWSGTFNIPGYPDVKTVRDFLSNPAAQKAAFDAHTANMDTQIKAQGLDKYIGQNVGGVPITREGLHAMIHLGGADGARVALQTNGRVNPADANGTSLLDYARLGAAGAQGTPAANMWLAGNRALTVQTEARAAWKTIQDDYTKSGIRPANAVLGQLVDSARLTHDAGLLDTIASGIDRMNTAQHVAQEPLPQQGADIGTLNQAGQQGLLQPGQAAVLKDLQRKNEAITKGLADNPIATAVQNFSDRLTMSAPLNLKDPDAFAGGLAQRAKIAQFAAQNWQTGPVSALDAADLAQVKGALNTNDPAAKAAVFQGIATLPPDVRAATLKKLGGNDPATMADAAAGSMLRTAPDVAQSIFRGQAAMKADDKWDVEKQPQGKASFAGDLDKNLPATIFSQQARTDPTGPYATMSTMVKARYADLSAQAGDSKYNAGRVEQAVTDVTGGVLAHNDAPLIAPVRGMTQGQFDGVVAGVTDKDLAGVTTLNGQPVTAAYLRMNAQLESASDGRYFLRLGRDPSKPIYAYQGANTEAPRKFTLDLRGRSPVTPALDRPIDVNP